METCEGLRILTDISTLLHVDRVFADTEKQHIALWGIFSLNWDNSKIPISARSASPYGCKAVF